MDTPSALYVGSMKYLAIILACFGAPLWAHPHVFVDTGLKLVANEAGEVTGVEVQWRYDELYSLLVLEDMELDHDFDGILTKPELNQLSGFDLNWIEGFEGDLYLSAGGHAVSLGAPENRGTSVENGQIISRHFRAFTGVGKEFVLKAYDPTYYTSYELTLGIDLPEGCKLAVVKADVKAANAKVRAEMGDNMDKLANDPNADWPAVGEDYADEVRVSCGAGL